MLVGLQRHQQLQIPVCCFVNGMLAAALRIRCFCLAETFLIVPLSAQTRVCVCVCALNSATNLLTVQWSRLDFFVKYPRFSYFVQGIQLVHAFVQQRFFLPILLANVGLLNNVEHPSSVVFPLVGHTWQTIYHKWFQWSKEPRDAIPSMSLIEKPQKKIMFMTLKYNLHNNLERSVFERLM